MSIHMQRVIDYINRYAPSRKRLGEYMKRKGFQDADTILHEIGYDEDMMANMWIGSYIQLGKGENDIRQKLRLKGFSRECIMNHIEKHGETLHDWSEYKNTLETEVERYIQRGKSKKMIAYILTQKYPYFSSEIDELLSVRRDADALEKEVQKYKNRYNCANPQEREKCIRALMGKGFRYSDIHHLFS